MSDRLFNQANNKETQSQFKKLKDALVENGYGKLPHCLLLKIRASLLVRKELVHM